MKVSKRAIFYMDASEKMIKKGQKNLALEPLEVAYEIMKKDGLVSERYYDLLRMVR